jgi:adenylate cyclase class 2
VTVLEVEVKYRAPDPAAVLDRLLTLGAKRAWEADEADHYFNGPDRDYRQTDEAFRIRRTADDTRLTYKGPKREAATKTRKEIEVRIGDGREETAAGMTELLVCLGFRPVAVVRKKRVVYRLDRPVGGKARRVEVCFDEVERVGSFVEVEALAEESEFEDAKAAVLGLAAELGLTAQERRSYLGLLLEAMGKP